VLPRDYPFALDDASLETVETMFSKVVADYNGNHILWNQGLKIMKGINTRLSIDYLANEYLHYFERIMLLLKNERDDS
jgi:hypothetical protein